MKTTMLVFGRRLRFLRGRWSASGFFDLPAIDQARDEVARDYGLLAGGLALLLSRHDPGAARRLLAASLDAYRTLDRQARRGAAFQLSAHQLMEVSHEIAGFVDRTTLDAALRCLRRQQAGPARAGEARPSFLQ